MGTLTLRLMGAPEALYEGRLLQFRTRKTLALLAYLATEGEFHSREKLTALLWPEKEQAPARASLRNTLSYLHTTLRPVGGAGASAPFVLARGDTLGIDPSATLDLDIRNVLAAARGRASSIGSAEIASLEAALAACRGEFLEGFSVEDAAPFDDWAAQQRETWHRRVGTLLDRLSIARLDRGDTQGAIEVALRWTLHSPLDEAAHRRLMQAQAAAGDYSAALRAYERLRGLLTAELRATPSSQTEALAARLRAGEPSGPGRSTQPPSVRQDVSTAAVASRLVGRIGEFARLGEILRATQAGAAQAAILEGEAGIGKTRLAGDFLFWAVARGGQILQGRAFEAGGRVPYRPIVEALRPRIERENAPDDLLGDVWLAEISRLLPELRERYPDLPPGGGSDSAARTRLFEAVARLIEALAAGAPLVLFLDDIHWADADTLDLLHYAARRWAGSGAPVLLMLAVRADERCGSPALARWLGDLGREIPAHNLTLGPLSQNDTILLVRDLSAANGDDAGLAERFGRWLYDETSGQPFYLVETLRALLESGLLLVADAAEGQARIDFSAIEHDEAKLRGFLPPSVQEVIRSRLGRLKASGFSLLAAAAVLGRDFGFERLCAVSGVDEGAGLLALDELIAARLLQATPADSSLYTFTHDKIRAVAYSEAGGARRRLFHRRAFEILSAAGAPHGELAQHAHAAGLNQQAVVAYLAAGDAAMRLFALQAAIGYFEQVRELLRQAGKEPHAVLPPAEIEGLYTQLGRAYELTGKVDLARLTFEEMLATARSGLLPRLEASALNRLATRAAQDYGDLATARALLEQAALVAETSGDDSARAETEWNLAHTSFYNSNMATALLHGTRALELARSAGAAELTARSLNALSYSEMETYRWGEGEAHAQEALDLYRALGDRAMQVDCLCLLAKAHIALGHAAHGAELARQAQRIGWEIVNAWGEANGGLQLAWALLDQGYWDAALAQAARALELIRRHEIMPLLGAALAVAGAIHRALLDLPAAVAAHGEGLEVAESLAVEPFRTTLAAELCADYAMLGEWEKAHHYARLASATRENRLHYYSGLTYWYETAALLRAGDKQLALEDLHRFGERAMRGRRYYVPYLRSLAELEQRRGNIDAAIRHVAEAASLAGELGLPGEQLGAATALAALSRAHGRAKESEAAGALADAALDLLDRRIADEQVRAALMARLAALQSQLSAE